MKRKSPNRSRRRAASATFLKTASMTKPKQSIAEYKDLIEHAEIVDNVDHNLPRDAVTLGSIVVVKDLEENVEDRYEIVGSQEANPREGRISDDSPVGKGLIGHRAGESLSIPVPSGEIRLQIVSVENT